MEKVQEWVGDSLADLKFLKEMLGLMLELPPEQTMGHLGDFQMEHQLEKTGVRLVEEVRVGVMVLELLKVSATVFPAGLQEVRGKATD